MPAVRGCVRLCAAEFAFCMWGARRRSKEN
eukprot:SAG31_NODE_45634_length_258_cov_0.647799_1_plen_29_part_10